MARAPIGVLFALLLMWRGGKSRPEPFIMASYNYGKKEIVNYIKDHYKQGSTCLDVGACDGKWFRLLGKHLKMDAVEVWKPCIDSYRLEEKYSRVFNADIKDLHYVDYDLIIFGDVLEHMTVEDAQKALQYAKEHSKEIIIGIPYQYKQGAINGNPYEVHIQDDLTPELFAERYPDFKLLLNAAEDYAYYHL